MVHHLDSHGWQDQETNFWYCSVPILWKMSAKQLQSTKFEHKAMVLHPSKMLSRDNIVSSNNNNNNNNKTKHKQQENDDDDEEIQEQKKKSKSSSCKAQVFWPHFASSMPSSAIKGHLQCQVKNAGKTPTERVVYFLCTMFVSESKQQRGNISEYANQINVWLGFYVRNDRILKTLDPLCLFTSDLHHVGRCSLEKNALLKQSLNKCWNNLNKNKWKQGMKESQGPSTLFSPTSIANSLKLWPLAF